MVYKPDSGDLVEGVPVDISRTLRRRTFLVEKAKDANIIGKPPDSCVACLCCCSPPLVPCTTGPSCLCRHHGGDATGGGLVQAAEEMQRPARAAGTIVQS